MNGLPNTGINSSLGVQPSALYASTADPDLTGSSRFAATNGDRNNPPPAAVLTAAYLNDDSLVQGAGRPEGNPRYNPLNGSRPRSSVLLDMEDPVAMHLLVETAIFDSNEYEILSYEEVDDLKKELSFLSNRIDACKRKLALESKVREAALSISRLYQNKKGPKRRSLLGGGGTQDVAKQTDDELIASNRKCDDLALELWRLNSRAVDIQRRLLQHSTGILGYSHPAGGSQGRSAVQNGAPRLTSKDRTFFPKDSPGTEFDERSLYRTVDKLDDINSPSRRAIGTLGASWSETADSSVSTSTLQLVEERLHRLNSGLAALTNISAMQLPTSRKRTADLTSLGDQLDILESSIKVITDGETTERQMHSKSVADQLEKSEATMHGLWDLMASGEELRRSDRTGSNISDEETETPATFSVSAFSTKVQSVYNKWRKLQIKYGATRSELERSKLDVLEQEQKVQQLSLGLNEMANSVEQLTALADQREADLVSTRNKISQMSSELKSSEDLVRSKDEEVRTAREELQMVMQSLDIARKEIQMKDNKRSASDNEALANERRARTAAEESFRKQLRDKEASLSLLTSEHNELKLKSASLTSESETSKQEIQVKVSRLQEELEMVKAGALTTELARDVAQDANVQTQEALKAKSAELARVEADMRGLEMDVVRLNTEVAMSKAQLDEAYGSRSQRQAEAKAAAAQGSSEREIALEKRVNVLQRELNEMLNDYEVLTKSSIEFENDRTGLEALVDALRDKAESLEVQLADETVKWLGIRSGGLDGKANTPGSGDGPITGESTSILVVKNEFKKMMRDMRADQQKILKAEQEERKKLELTVRNLRKELQKK